MKLRVRAAGEPVDPDVSSLVLGRYDQLYAMLQGENLVSWPLTGDIPDYASLPVTWMLAYLCSGEFSIDPGMRAELALDGELNRKPPSRGEMMLRRQLAAKHVSYPHAADYY